MGGIARHGQGAFAVLEVRWELSSKVAPSQHLSARNRSWLYPTLAPSSYNVGVEQHESAKSWFWLRGEGGAGRALAGVRHEAGLTQQQIADRLRMDRTTVLNMEAGRNPAVNRFVGLFGWMGYDLIAVPRGAKVTVDTRPAGSEPS